MGTCIFCCSDPKGKTGYYCAALLLKNGDDGADIERDTVYNLCWGGRGADKYRYLDCPHYKAFHKYK